MVVAGLLLLAIFGALVCLVHGSGRDECCASSDCSDCRDCHCAACACLVLALHETSNSCLEVSEPRWTASEIVLIPSLGSAIFHPPRPVIG
jgi:hypothetical protein